MALNNGYPSTCHCVLQWNTPFVKREAIQLEQCRTHNTAQECLDHNARFTLSSEIDKQTERRKPEFQRR